MSLDAMPRGRPSLREQHATTTRERVLGAAVEILEAGNEPSMRAIAKQAAIGERTLCRYFPSRAELWEAVAEYLRGRIGAAPPNSSDELPDYVERLFGVSWNKNGQPRSTWCR